MKKVVLLFIVMFLLTVIAFGQSNSINYKAIIKDGSGNVVANTAITVQFQILEDVTNVYQETHTPTTDANGLVILNIGEGAVDSGSYTTIAWASDDHFLNVQINTGTGLVDLGTTQFLAVPYAINAGNVTGIETLDEGNGIGWRLVGKDPVNHGDIGVDAIDLSKNNTGGSTRGATGENSIAMGRSTTAQGKRSTAMGISTIAEGDNSTSMGQTTNATGRNSTAMGKFTDANAFNSIAMGQHNIGGGDATTWVETDPLLEVGNGVNSGNKNNALTILKNGTITAPTFDIAEITDDKALITKEYLEANGSSGLETLDEGNGFGWRLKGNPLFYGNIGLNAVDLSISTTSALFMGATGDYSIAMGTLTKATGIFSTAMGTLTEAIGSNSTAMGTNTKAESANSTAIGTYNVGGGSPTSLIQTDPLFEVGNGSSPSNKSNALTILKNGKVGIGTATPDTELVVAGIISAAFDTTETDKIEIAHGGSNAYINVVGTGNLAFRHEGSTGMTFTDTDRLGIGTATPDEKLSVAGILNLKEDIATAGTALKVNGDQALWYDGTRFSWGYGGTSNTFAYNVGFGMTSVPSFRIDVRDSQDSDYIAQIYNSSSNSAADGLKIRLNASNPDSSNFFVGFFDGSNTARGKITGDGAGTLYQTTSDRRLKTNIVDVENSLELINKIQSRKYEFKSKLGKEEYGFIAQELQPLYPQAVSGSPDSDITKDPMMVDYSRLTPLLTAGIKELDEKFNVFEKENKRLKNENEKLKVQLSKYEALEERLTALENQKITNSILIAEK